MNAKKTVRICGNDISKYLIILPEDASLAEINSANELKAHILEATNIALAISNQPAKYNIFIGNAAKLDKSNIKYDGYVLATDEQNLYLFGAIDRGTVYSVYRFLEIFIGFGKYAPGVERLLDGDCEIPAKLYYTSNPAFELRRTDWIGHTEDARFAAWEMMNTQYFPESGKYGGILTNVGGCHTFERLCDPKDYFEEHPEYYSLYNGKRIPAGNVFDRPCGQLCLTNPDVLEIVISNVKKWLSENPDANIVEVSQNDNTKYCQCEKCAAIDAEEGSPSGLMLRFVNSIADAIAKDYPNVLVQTFAYQYTRKAPKITKPRKNVIIRYCTIEACFRHALYDEACEKNAGKFADELVEWNNICDKISIWDYTTNYSCYLAPFPNFEILRENVRFFADNHAIHVFEEDTPGTHTSDLGDLRAYLLARLLWNPYMSEEEYESHISDFLEGFYGAGWQNIRKYMRLLDDTTSDKHMGCFQKMDTGFLGSDPLSEGYIPKPYQEIAEDSYLRDFIPHLEEAIKLWDETEALACDDAQIKRIRRSKLSVTYLNLFCRPRDKEKMTDAEKEAYENEVFKYYKDKEYFGIRTNIWTQRIGH